ncbi:MAG TPA: coproporphyrinogen III oxidase family protein [Deltaproteobacteria bacterium]|nr:coproporphyrinogen III oxidase family protein [Deltaproteobacteria bacterium]
MLNLGSPYQGYVYSYPHKTAYRALSPPVPLARAWADEDRGRLFAYAHVPFCEMRCGFCNLFTTAGPPEALVERWLSAWRAEVEATAAALGGARFARFAIGGGTPTWLTVEQLTAVFDGLAALGVDCGAIPGSVEVSPGTVTADKAALLIERGTTRISMGVQSLVLSETEAVYRPQSIAAVESAIAVLRDAAAPILNLDLMYGLPGQTEASWRHTLRRVLSFEPEELYLYPLYVREQTGLGRHGEPQGPGDDEPRLRLYRIARELLEGAGYHQRSMRLFCRAHVPGGPVYRCQEDGMVGVGVGARSYTQRLHWSTPFAVGARGIRGIIEDWIASDPSRIRWGIALDEAEQRRRWLILSLLCSEGADAQRYPFGELEADFPELRALLEAGLAERRGAVVRLTPAGLERSDAIGPWLISRPIRERMDAAEIA